MHFSTQSLYLSVLTLSSSTAVLAAVEPYGRCGGQGHVGETACASGWECKVSNPYYSQCIQGTGSAPAPEAPPAAAQPSAAAPPAENNDTAPAPVAEATTLMTKTKSSATSIVVAPSATAIAAAAPVAKAGANGADCSINAKFIAKGKKYIGVAADSGTLGDATNKQVIIDNFGQVTPENSMKWDATEAVQGKFTFTGANALVDFATTNKKLIRGHTTVWHSQLPTWVSSIKDKKTLTDVMNNHITKMISQYKGKVYAWDVVNEILAEDGNFRSSVFYNVLGESFVATAFKTARAADPAAKLYINDYNLDSPTYAKTKGMATKVAAWVAAGVPIDGIGSQSHLSGVWPIADYPKALASLCAAASECAITELDIKGASVADYQTAIGACADQKKCVGVTVWGVSDKNSWIPGSNPLLFDGQFKAKPAYNALCKSL